MTRTEIEDVAWDLLVRISCIDANPSYIRYGKGDGTRLPSCICILINRFFDNPADMRNFFCPLYKEKNIYKFRGMLRSIAPFSYSDLVFHGALFSIIDTSYQKTYQTPE